MRCKENKDCSYRRAGILRTGLFVLFFLFSSSPVFAYEIETHAQITEQATSQAAHFLSFVNQFQLDGGLQIETIKNGSRSEDDDIRALHHFYDPTNDLGLTVPLFPDGQPSLAWGFNGGQALRPNAFSWTKAREYLYAALTSAAPEQRNQNLHGMFRSLGQVMHLVQDLAQPAHVRNDLHLFHPAIGGNMDLYEKYVDLKYNPSWATGYPTVRLNRFSDYWTAPQGLAFFTNRNFISQDTNFDSCDLNGNLFYDLPQIQGIITKTETITDQFRNRVDVQVDYGINVISDSYTGEVLNNDRLTAFSVFNFEAQELIGRCVPSTNDFTRESAANLLVRRAVGYSAGLLDYFFRGQIDLIKDPNAAGQYLIHNRTAEPLSGAFLLYYDDMSDQRHLITSWNLSIDSNGQSTPVTFIAPTFPEPKVRGKYLLLFQGRMGEESGAVTGRLAFDAVLPDLRGGVADISIEGEDTSIMEIIIHNSGAGVAGATTHEVYVAFDGVRKVEAVSSPSLTPGGSISTRLTFHDVDNFCVAECVGIVVVDAANAVQESDEENNCTLCELVCETIDEEFLGEFRRWCSN